MYGDKYIQLTLYVFKICNLNWILITEHLEKKISDLKMHSICPEEIRLM